jgi:hypothetical protein
LLGLSGFDGSTIRRQKLRRHSSQIGSSCNGKESVISRSAHRSFPGHLPQTMQSYSNVMGSSSVARLRIMACSRASRGNRIGARMADTSLWPVVVGGLLTVGGTMVGLIGTTIRDVAQQRHEKAKRRADKFEELVAAVYEFDEWVQAHRHATIDRIQFPQTTSPMIKVSTISSVYFPQFDKLAFEMEVASLMYLNSILSKNFKQEYIYLNDKEQGKIAAEYWMDLGAKRTELTNALKKFAHDEFQ